LLTGISLAVDSTADSSCQHRCMLTPSPAQQQPLVLCKIRGTHLKWVGTNLEDVVCLVKCSLIKRSLANVHKYCHCERKGRDTIKEPYNANWRIFWLRYRPSEPYRVPLFGRQCQYWCARGGSSEQAADMAATVSKDCMSATA